MVVIQLVTNKRTVRLGDNLSKRNYFNDDNYSIGQF